MGRFGSILPLHSPAVIYTLSYGIETLTPLNGTEEELLALLETYPLTVVFDVLIFEKLAGGAFYLPLKRYAARRAVEEMSIPSPRSCRGC